MSNPYQGFKSGARHFYASEGALTEANTPSYDAATPAGKCLAPSGLSS